MTREQRDRERTRQASEDLKKASAESEVVGTSGLARHAEQAKAHFSGADADPDDAVEVWGRRIGRGLSLMAFTGLAIYLSVTYL